MTLIAKKAVKERVVFQTPEEANESIRKIRAGDMQEREEFFRRNYPTAIFMAAKYARMGNPYEECLSACHSGLLYAVKSYDETQEVSFSTYAMKSMEHRIWNQRRGIKAKKRAGSTLSLNFVYSEDTSDGEMMDCMQVMDPGFETLENVEFAQELMRRYLMTGYPERDLRMFQIYVEEGLPQWKIAEKFGVLQMSVSRSLKRVKERLKKIAEDMQKE